jgi:hypothetical protein
LQTLATGFSLSGGKWGSGMYGELKRLKEKKLKSFQGMGRKWQ